MGRTAGVFLLAIMLGVIGSAAISAALPRPLATPPGAVLITFNVAVDPGSADYVQRAAQAAIAAGDDLIIVMNTPGGLLVNMQQIVVTIQGVQSHGLAVYTFVPPVAFAASAGSYIALATNAIYMGSGSIIGPSTPFVVGGDPSEEQHVKNAMIAYIASLAQKNGYSVVAAIDMAANNTAYPAAQAAAVGLVTGRAETLDSFLGAVGLSGVPVTTYDEPLYDQFLSFLSDPTVDGLFILVGIIALVLDLFHRTLFLSVMAVIFIALGFLGAQLIGAQLVGILVLIVAAALVILEVKAGHGFFAISGIALGLAGTFLLANGVQYSAPPGTPYGVVQDVILGVTGAALMVGFVYLTRIRRALMGQPKLVDPGRVVNMTGRATTDIGPDRQGVANVAAEDWTAVSDEAIEKGAWVQVTSYEEGKVHVRKAPAPGTEPKGSAESSKSA